MKTGISHLLEEGHIVEQGPPDELIRQGPVTCIICNVNQSEPAYRWCNSCYQNKQRDKNLVYRQTTLGRTWRKKNPS